MYPQQALNLILENVTQRLDCASFVDRQGGVPITRFGEDSLGLWFHAKPGTIMRVESIPPGLAVGSMAFFAISPGTVERVNVSVGKQIAEGRRIIEAAGGLQAHDQQVRLANLGKGIGV